MRKVYLRGLLLALTLFCSASLWAYDFMVETEDEDGNKTTFYYNITSEAGAENPTVEVTFQEEEIDEGNAYTVTSINIPSSVTYKDDEGNETTYAVTSIGHHAFYNCTKLATVALPESIVLIDSYAFYWCTSLTSVNIPESVTTIGADAFVKCTKLTSIEIPSSVTSVGANAFQYCSALESMTLPEGLTTIENYTFDGCTKLASIEISESVTSIGKYAFRNCTTLETVALPSSLTSIGDFAFYQCTALTSVVLPDNVTTIGGDAFYGCTSLKTVTLPSSLTSIGSLAFSGCTSLTTIYSHMFNPVITTSGNAFLSNSGITLYVPEGYESAYEGRVWDVTFKFTIIGNIPWITVNAEEDTAEEDTAEVEDAEIEDVEGEDTEGEDTEDEDTEVSEGAWYSTYYNGTFSYVMPEGITGYAVTVADGSLVMTEAYASGDVVPAGTALLLKSDTEIEYVFPEVVYEDVEDDVEGDENSSEGGDEVDGEDEGTDEPEATADEEDGTDDEGDGTEGDDGTSSEEEETASIENWLCGSDTDAMTTGPEEEGSYLFYKLSFNTDGEALGFYWGDGADDEDTDEEVDGDNEGDEEVDAVADEDETEDGDDTEDETVTATGVGGAFLSKAHKAWLAVPVDSEGDVKISGFSFCGFTQTTGITAAPVEAVTRANAPVYDLSGRRVSKPTKGIYIQNGKKYIKK